MFRNKETSNLAFTESYLKMMVIRKLNDSQGKEKLMSLR